MLVRLERRAQPSRALAYLAPLVAVLLTLLVGFALFYGLGRDPWEGFHTFFIRPVSTLQGVSELALKASPLILIAVGLGIGFRAGVWNIGAEGQLAAGAICATWVALEFDETGSVLVLPAMLVAGAAGGMAWAAIPAYLRTRFNTSEILTSLMLGYVASLLLGYLVHGPWRDPQGFNFPQTKLFGAAATFAPMFDGYRVNTSILLALAVLVVGFVFVRWSFIAYKMRVSGLTKSAAQYAGFAENGSVWMGMLAGGAMAGLAGVGEAAGSIGQLVPHVSPGYGFAAIIVAFVGRLEPPGILLAGLLLALLYLGGEQAQIVLKVPSAVTGVFQGTLLFFLLGAEVLVNYRVRVGDRTGPVGSVAT